MSFNIKNFVLAVQSELVTVNVVYNIPVPEPLELYGIGDAFTWAWDRSKAEKMATEDHIHFTWSGKMEAGEGKMFKFLTNESIANESWLPSYVRNAESEQERDEKIDELIEIMGKVFK